MKRVVSGAPIGLVVLAALVVAGCSVGPKYRRPALQPPTSYKEPVPDSYREWQTAHPADAELRGDWWTLFGDPELNALEAQVDVSNQNLKAAEARFEQA